MHLHEHEFGSSPQRSASPKGEHETVSEALEPLRAGRNEAATPQGIAQLQRAAGNGSVSELLNPDEAVHDVVGRGGQPLDSATQRDMEARMGADFSDVRVHNDSRASESAQALRADAYTVGSDIVFKQGRYDPASAAGQRTLAHELTHVVQQREGPVDGTAVGGGSVKVSDPGDHFEQAAERNADRVMGTDAPAAQREAPEEEELQMTAQRQDEEEELQMTAQRQDEEEELQMTAQRQAPEEEELPA